METFSIWHWLVILVYVSIIVVPFWRILSKAGYSGALSILAIVPLVNIVLLWVFAFSKWPIEKN